MVPSGGPFFRPPLLGVLDFCNDKRYGYKTLNPEGRIGE